MSEEKLLLPVKQVMEFLPEDERPNFDDYIEHSKKVLKNALTTKQDYKGYKFPPVYTSESVKWQYDNFNPTAEDVLISTMGKTGKKLIA